MVLVRWSVVVCIHNYVIMLNIHKKKKKQKYVSIRMRLHIVQYIPPSKKHNQNKKTTTQTHTKTSYIEWEAQQHFTANIL